jgi:hypothetical protein
MKWRMVVACVVLSTIAGIIFSLSRRSADSIVSDPMPEAVSISRAAPREKTNYRLSVQFDPATSQISTKQLIRVTNNEEQTLQELYFHLFPNSPFFQGPKDHSPISSLAVENVTMDGQRLRATIVDREILRISLPRPLNQGESVELAMQWREQIPTSPGRFGLNQSTVYLGNFYPILAVRDKNGWHLDRYLPTGDPFFSEVADYEATFEVPAAFVVAATGQSDSAQTLGSTSTYHFMATNVRDFAAAISSQWHLYETSVDGIKIRYYRDQVEGPGGSVLTPEQALDVIAGSLHFFNEKLGKYPYGDLSVVDHGGMEYPQFVMAAARAEVIVHELAHQWWYGVVGNDEVRQIWDEGLSEFSAMYYLATIGRPKDVPFRLARSEAMNKSLYVYWSHSQDSSFDYYATEYGRGWMLWEALRRAMGPASFEHMVREFYSKHQFAIATWEDWREAVVRAAGDRAVRVFDSYVTGEPTPADAPSSILME